MPLLASLSTVFEECVADNYPIPDEYVEPTEIPIGESNIQIIDNCLMGFVDAIRVTSNFQMDTERDAFVSSLGKLSGLTDLATIKAKNVAAARTLVFFGVNFGNCLDESWVCTWVAVWMGGVKTTTHTFYFASSPM